MTRQPARTEIWLLPLLLILVSAVSSFAFACITPLAAFAVVAAYALPIRTALLTVTGVWLANQVVGFGYLHYPLDLTTALWGIAIGGAALLSTVGARIVMRGSGRNIVVALGSGLVVALGVYEMALFLVSFGLGGQDGFTAPIVGYVALLNLAWTVGLVGAVETLRRTRAIGFDLARSVP
jgi:hypothetical protein